MRGMVVFVDLERPPGNRVVDWAQDGVFRLTPALIPILRTIDDQHISSWQIEHVTHDSPDGHILHRPSRSSCSSNNSSAAGRTRGIHITGPRSTRR